MKDEILELRRAILRFRDELMLKPEDQRTEMDAMVIETSQVLADALIQYQHRCAPETGKARNLATLLRAYNAVNRREVDVDVLEAMRAPIERD